MDAPKCRLCGERHYGACPVEPTIPPADPVKTWRRGRRIAGEAHLVIERQKPWLALGMSRATYFRRKRDGKL